MPMEYAEERMLVRERDELRQEAKLLRESLEDLKREREEETKLYAELKRKIRELERSHSQLLVAWDRAKCNNLKASK